MMKKLCASIAIFMTLAGLPHRALALPTDSIREESGIRVQRHEPGNVLTAVYALEAGGEHAFSTYLSPLSHTGSTFAISGQWSRPFATPLWDMDIKVRARIGLLKNPTRNASMDDLGISLSWQANRAFSPLGGLTLKAGAGVMIDAGALYLPRNSNNPVAARAWGGLTLNGSARYDLRLWGKTFRLLDEVSLPSLGVFFSPHFGQSYYEIYLGDDSGLARCGWWGNHFAIDNLVAVEIPVNATRLRLGYRLNVMNSVASDIHSRITTHSLVLGISTDWVNVTRRHE